MSYRTKYLTAALFLSFLLAASASAQDTTGGIAWGPLIQLSSDTVMDGLGPSIAVQGDTVHVTWFDGGLPVTYARSVNGGQSFEPLREIAPDSVGNVGSCWFIPAGKRLIAFFLTGVSQTHGEFLYYMYSDDRGSAWTIPQQLSQIGAMPFSAAASGDTVAYLVGEGHPLTFRLTVSSDGGEHWLTRPFAFMSQVGPMKIAFAGGALHLVSSGSFDSLGNPPEVVMYRRSTDLGATWSDSVKMSSVDSPEASEATITAYPNGDSSRIFVAWRDAKYGCLTDVGCSIFGRWSNDNGKTFGPEVHLDQRPSGDKPIPSSQDTIMAISWVDDIPYTVGPTVVTMSNDRGLHWTTPYPVCDTASGDIAVSGNTIHAVFERLVGGTTWGHFRIFYRRGTILPPRSSLYVTMQEDWNLISLPLHVPGSRRSVLFPFSASYAYSYMQGYVAKETLSMGNGYWLKFDQYYRGITYCGEPVSRVTLDLRKGWNLIGALSSPAGLGNISTTPPGIVTSLIYGYSNGYNIADTLYPAQGYWIKLAQDGKLVIDSSSSTPGNAIAKLPQLEQLSRLTMRDAAGKSQSLYFGSDSSDGMWELPPPPPAGVFDCRFESGRMAEFACGKAVTEAPILVSSASFPVTITWNTKSGSPPAELLIGAYAIPLTGSGSTKMYDGKSSVVLRLNAMGKVPREFTLHQNYPNPFNPVTRIRYSLPAAGMTSLIIYDVFGREIAALVNGRMEVGEHDAEWNATSFASGVYFCRLSWHDPQQGLKSYTKKMLLIK
jgi:hypothetical protein